VTLWLLVLFACVDEPASKRPRGSDSAATLTTPAGTLTTPTGTLTTPAGTPTLPTARPDNVLVVLLDDVGLDKVGFADEHPRPPPTPVIDAFAAESLHFRNAWAHPTCSPSRAALLTGRSPRRYGIGHALGTDDRWELPLAEITLPELLRDAPDAWSNAMFGKWHLSTGISPGAHDHPNQQGFDHFQGSIGNLGSYLRWQRTVDGVVAPVDTYPSTDTVDAAIHHLETLPEPWFVYVAFNAAHTPFHVPPAHLHDQPVGPDSPPPGKLAAMVQAMDTELGRLLAAVEPARDHTTVFVIGDNGTTGDAVLHPADPSLAKLTLAEGGVNVPFLVRSSRVTSPGGESPALVHLVDVFATVADLAGVAPPAPIDGLSLLPQLADPSAPLRSVVYTDRFGPPGAPPYRYSERAVRNATHKLLRAAAVDRLHRVDDRGVEGPRLDLALLTPDEQATYDELRTELDRLERELVFAY
jgi:arylsulfatase A-like enzyme